MNPTTRRRAALRRDRQAPTRYATVPFRFRTALLLALALAMIPARAAFAQQGDDALADLRTPASPAFILLGVSPTSIARPTTPRALGLSLLSATGDLSTLPRNYALEFAPYWLKPRDALLFDEYYNPTTQQAVAQTFTVSVASTPGIASDSGATNLAVGFRFMPFVGAPSEEADELITRIRERQRRIADLTEQVFDAESDEEIRRLEARIDSLEAANADDSRDFAEANPERDGLRLEIAGALAGRFPGDAFDDGEVSRYALWATLGFRVQRSLDAALVARFIRNERGDGQNLAGFGGQLSYLGDDLTIAAEYISRWTFDVASVPAADGSTLGTITFDSTYRLAGNVEYRISDDVRLTGTFGKDYREPGGPRRPLVAVLGVDLAFGKVPGVGALVGVGGGEVAN